MSDISEEIREMLLTPRQQESLDWSSGLNSGSTLLNLACSGNPNVAFLRGGIYYFVGDSGSGKTFITMSCMAEAANNKNFDNYKLVFDNAENGALMDFRKFFGKKMTNRLIPPVGTKEEPIYSATVEDFYFNLYSLMEKGPVIYLLDSMDALTTDDETDTFLKNKKANEKGKEASGSYGTSKAKLNSSYIRVVFNKLRETGSILLMISQTRDNIGFGAMFTPKTRSGGKALTFYSHLEIWSSVKGHITTKYKDKDREQGITCKLHIKKNRLTGRDRKIDTHILHSYGIDDIGTLVDYLIEENKWEKSGGRIQAKAPIEFTGFREKLIEHIQEKNLYNELKQVAYETWTEIEKAVEVNRTSRYE